MKVFRDETQLGYIKNHILALPKRMLSHTVAQWLGGGGGRVTEMIDILL